MAVFTVGSIGLGGISGGVHLPGIHRSKDLQQVALCDIDEKKLAQRAEEYGIDAAHCFTDYRALIRCPEVQAIDISTPNDLHFPVAMAAAEAGKPFCLEKPVTLSAAQADQLMVKVREKNLTNMVCFSYRFKAAARYARDLIARGEIGELYHIDAQYMQGWGLPEPLCKLVWRFDEPRTGSGTLGDLGCHVIDLARFISGREYVKCCAHAKTYVKERPRPENGELAPVAVDDFCNILAEMEGGTSAMIHSTRFAFGRGNYQRLEFYGSKGALVYKLDEKPGVDELEVCIGTPARETCTYTTVPIPGRYHVDQMQSFADLLNGCEDGLAATLADGQINQHMLDAIIEAYKQEKWISLR